MNTTRHGLNTLPQYITDDAASRADDERVALLIAEMDDAGVIELAIFQVEWDAVADEGREEAINRRALVVPPLPWRVWGAVDLALLCVLIFAWVR